ncbi:hypothetical protein RFF05_11615 [Bengtsoniella intestinalis]|uniref:hypothetical protein n=1 Tax=Bengtsoniella intestinalis TaxID=3073143 RepID=UPI00391F968C
MSEEYTELKLYSPLTGDFTRDQPLFEEDYEESYDYDQPEDMDAEDLANFQEEIEARIAKEPMYDDNGRGLMAYYHGLESVDDKVHSVHPTVETIDGKLYGVTVCKLKAELTSEELSALKEYCTGQYSDGWGEGFEQRDIDCGDGSFCVHFWQWKDFKIQTKEEFEVDRLPKRTPHTPKRGGDAR